jgi:hypothetical protein
VVTAAEIEQAAAIRRRVRLASGRPDGRCGKVAEAIAAELGWTYRWGHLRLLDGGICWIHCWNQLPDGAIVDATADQFEERWLGAVVVLPVGDARHANYRPAPPGHLFRVVRSEHRLRLLARRGLVQGQFDPAEQELAAAPDTARGWAELGARAVQVHSGWPLPAWINQEAGERLRAAEAAGLALPSRELEFALDAAAQQRRNRSHGEWTSPEWRESLEAGERSPPWCAHAPTSSGSRRTTNANTCRAKPVACSPSSGVVGGSSVG